MAHIDIKIGGNLNSDFANIMTNLNKELSKVKAKSARGLVLAALHIRNATEASPPVTPVDLGNLRASWFIVAKKEGVVKGQSPPFVPGTKKKPRPAGFLSMLREEHAQLLSESQGEVAASPKIMVICGYSANYTAPVHEKLGARFKKQGAGPRWFQEHIERETPNILKIVEENAKIK